MHTTAGDALGEPEDIIRLLGISIVEDSSAGSSQAALAPAPQPGWLVDPFDNELYELPWDSRGKQGAVTAALQDAPRPPRLAVMCTDACHPQVAAAADAQGRAASGWPMDIAAAGVQGGARTLVLTLAVNTGSSGAQPPLQERAFSATAGVGVRVSAGSRSDGADAGYTPLRVAFDLSGACAGRTCVGNVTISAAELSQLGAGGAVPVERVATAQLRLRVSAAGAPAPAPTAAHSSVRQGAMQLDRVRWRYPVAVASRDGVAVSDLLRLQVRSHKLQQ